VLFEEIDRNSRASACVQSDKINVNEIAAQSGGGGHFGGGRPHSRQAAFRARKVMRAETGVEERQYFPCKTSPRSTAPFH